MHGRLAVIYHAFKVRLVGWLFVIAIFLVAFIFAGSILFTLTRKAPPSQEPEVQPSLSFSAGTPQAGTLTELVLRIPMSSHGDGMLIPDSEGKYTHIFIANDELILFGHDHPDDYPLTTDAARTRGEFRMPILFPKSGWYSIAAVYATRKKQNNVRLFDVAVSDSVGTVPERAVPHPDMRTSKNFQDYLVSLATSPESLTTCAPVQLKYETTREGIPVSDFERVDASDAVITAWDTNLKKFVHAQGKRMREQNGSRLAASLLFASPGTYQVFSEFKHRGEIIPSSFFVNVEGGTCSQ